MAFDLYSGNFTESVEHHEEGIFEYVDSVKHPQVNRMKDSFYRSPVFSPEQSNDLVHELICIHSTIEKDKDNKYLVAIINRLLVFFSHAYKNGQQVRSESD